jgi:hypothetical protein
MVGFFGYDTGGFMLFGFSADKKISWNFFHLDLASGFGKNFVSFLKGGDCVVTK